MISFFPWNKPGRSRASALVITLFAVTIVTILTVTLLLIARYERSSSALALGRARSEALADLASDVAVLRLKEATEAGMDTGTPDKMWISEPGRIRVYDRDNLSRYTDYNLFSALPGPDTSVRDENNVDLNRASFDNEFPIAPPAPGNTTATMKVGWINLLADPTEANPSKANPMVGRIAYWIDDESCKVNINTADGSKKNNLYDPLTAATSQSYGFGTPSEISLEALKNTYASAGTNLTNALAARISQYAWDHGFNSAAEIGRIEGLPTDFFKNNKFNITHYSKIPELTFHGGPRIYLLPAVPVPAGTKTETWTALTGGQVVQQLAKRANVNNYAERIDFVYPTSKQLPKGSTTTFNYPNNYDLVDGELPQYPLEVGGDQSFNSNRGTFPLAIRIARALRSQNFGGTLLQWPAFNGTNSPATKYSPRQIDSIALQILDLANVSVFCDHQNGFSFTSVADKGIINNEIVSGVGRCPKFTEVFVQGTTGTKQVTVGAPPVTRIVPALQTRVVVEAYMPKYYLGSPLNDTYGYSINGWRFGNVAFETGPNNSDRAAVINEADTGLGLNAASPLGGFWSDNLLRIDATPGTPAYLDLTGNPSLNPLAGTPYPDPDSRANTYHPWAKDSTGTAIGSYAGNRRVPMLSMNGFTPITINWPAGYYLSVGNTSNGARQYPGGSGVYNYTGGVSLWTHDATYVSTGNIDFAPLDGMRGPTHTGESSASIKSILQMAVIPVEFSVAGSFETYVAQVDDPLVNKFPGDWKKKVAPSTVTIAQPTAANAQIVYGKNAPTDSVFLGTNPTNNTDGDNPGFKPSGGGDPLSLWMPRQDVRYPKQSRFPSVGALNYIRTGIIPDGAAPLPPINEQHGTPWRSINLSNVNQGVYPDWAMLDLFTVPFIPQSVYYKGPLAAGSVATPKRRLTYGGATEGKLNINNPKIPFPFDQNIAGVSQTPPERTAPLEALFHGIKVFNSYDANDNPVATTVDAGALRSAVQAHLASNGPFILPGQLAQVPAVSNFTYSGVALEGRSRNDLMRQVIGATTTQSNVFSIWVVAQTIKKHPKNSNYGIFEPGDIVTGETRRRYIVERHIEYGIDGVPGNAVDKGPDGILGTADDPVDPDYNPAMNYPLPYRWKIVSVEDSKP